MDDTRTDGALVEALRAGDTMAFEVLIKRYERPLYGYITRQVGQRSVASDLYQQTLMQVVDRIGQLTEPEAFKAWVFGVASNLCRNHHRNERPSTSEGLDLLPEPSADPEQTAASRQTARRIAKALTTLPPVQREVFVLYHYTQLSYAEIAVVTQVPVGTVKSRMNAALLKLRDLLSTLAKERAA